MSAEHFNLALIGNSTVSALVDADARIVWSCMPRFDSDPVFCSLLKSNHDDRTGSYAIELHDFARSEQYYLPNTAILVTVLHDDHGGAVEVTDYAPRFRHLGRMYHPMMLVRRLRPVAGSPMVTVRLLPLHDHGAATPARTVGSNHVRYVAPQLVLRLTTDASVTAVLEELPFILDRPLTLILGPDESMPAGIGELGQRWFDDTLNYWHEWVRYLGIPFEWQEAVIRAAITLKLSAFEDTGAIVAAMTTSLPEAAHSGRNWDYRYCWLRDSWFVVRALNRLNVTGTMERYLHYIVNIAANALDGRLRPVYRISGKADLEESIVPGLDGYRGMGPVRIGNDAFRQLQNDVYGAVVLAATHIYFDLRLNRPGNTALLARLEALGEIARRIFDQPDAGIWELRTEARVHTFSSVICWVACDRLAKIAQQLRLDERVTYWRAHADAMHRVISQRAWNDAEDSFVASFGGTELDASLLLLHDLGFLAADDPRFAGTVAAVERHLKKGDFIFRYTQRDDFGVPETAFLVCTFWYVDALAALGRHEQARALFETLLACRTPLGLLAEDIDPVTREHWGNFPQTYSMVGLINSALRLSRSWEQAA
ncbi:MAG: glycoside hydrolase family 15 protein [Gammaproteobacteria bacterium]|nr:glycoside hydrolase family 15 protein [Gammaproteobacteria bacterium]